jgi:DNA modification methylase
MVAVFREVRRVLADHGTCWVNLGDSYAGHNLPGWRDGNEVKNGGVSNKNGVGYVPGLKPKDLVGIPWRVAFALQADGWYLRSDIIWSKPNPMPESVTDRPTKAHEYVFLLAKRPRYWFDAEAVREPGEPFRVKQPDGWDTGPGGHGSFHRNGREAGRQTDEIRSGRNVRSVWEIATQPYPEAHFATYPEELVRRCLLAGCPEWVCRTCGKARERIVDKDYLSEPTYKDATGEDAILRGRNRNVIRMGDGVNVTTLGWSDCGHNDYRPGVTLDPFLGSGTTALVARHHGRRCVGIELSPEYAALAARRLQQLSLLASSPMPGAPPLEAVQAARETGGR